MTTSISTVNKTPTTPVPPTHPMECVFTFDELLAARREFVELTQLAKRAEKQAAWLAAVLLVLAWLVSMGHPQLLPAGKVHWLPFGALLATSIAFLWKVHVSASKGDVAKALDAQTSPCIDPIRLRVLGALMAASPDTQAAVDVVLAEGRKLTNDEVERLIQFEASKEERAVLARFTPRPAGAGSFASSSNAIGG